MNCSITELKRKEVIDKSNGRSLGFASDVEVDSRCGRAVALIIYGRPKYLGVFGSREKIRVLWEDIDVVGDDAILVNKACRENERGRRGGKRDPQNCG